MTVAASEPDQRPTRRRLGTIDDVRRDFLPLPKSSLYDGFRFNRIPGAVRVGKRLLVDLDVLGHWIDAGGGTPEARK